MLNKWLGLAIVALSLVLPQMAQAKIWSPADGEQIVFSVYNGEKKIGFMSMQFDRPDAETLVVTREQNIAARRFMMKVSMDQKLIEIWRGDELMAMETDVAVETPVQDMVIDASYQRQADGGLMYKTEESQYLVEAGLLPSTLWHGKFLKQNRFFQPPTGKPVDISFRHKGKDEANGCHLFKAKSQPEEGDEAEFSIWFFSDGRPCRMEFPSPLGTLSYVIE